MEKEISAIHEGRRIDTKKIIDAINHHFDEAIITTDVGQNQLWATQFLALNENRQILFMKVNSCSDADIAELFRISKVFGVTIIDYDGTTVLLECTQTEKRNNDLIFLLMQCLWKKIRI